MRTSTLVAQSITLPSRPSLPSAMCRKRRPSSVFALKRDHNEYGKEEKGKLVDDNMILLRMRIKEIEMAEKCYEGPPSDWMEWEKKYYASSYNHDLYIAIGLLQALLMETRPSIVLGGILLLVFSFPTFLVLLLYQLIAVIQGAS